MGCMIGVDEFIESRGKVRERERLESGRESCETNFGGRCFILNRN